MEHYRVAPEVSSPASPAAGLTVITLIAAVVAVLGAFIWQPSHEEATGGGIQGGADPTPVHEKGP